MTLRFLTTGGEFACLKTVNVESDTGYTALFHPEFGKDCLSTGQEQVCTRISRSFGCLFVCLVVTMLKMADTQENGS